MKKTISTEYLEKAKLLTKEETPGSFLSWVFQPRGSSALTIS